MRGSEREVGHIGQCVTERELERETERETEKEAKTASDGKNPKVHKTQEGEITHNS